MFVFQGSSVTGRSFKTGEAFDEGRISDFDIGLVHDDTFLNALEIGEIGGFKMKSDPNRIGPLDLSQLEMLNLKEIADKLSKLAGRKVNFMLYESLHEALRKPSLFGG